MLLLNFNESSGLVSIVCSSSLYLHLQSILSQIIKLQYMIAMLFLCTQLFIRLMMRAGCLLVAGGHYHLCVVPLSLVSSESGTGDEYQLLIGRSLSLVRINRGGDLVTKTLCHYRVLGTDVTGTGLIIQLMKTIH